MSPSIAFARGRASSIKAARVNAVSPGPVWTPLNPADKEAEGHGVWKSHANEAPRADGRNRPRLCLSRVGPLFEFYYWRNPADHRRLYRRVRARVWVEPFSAGFV